MKISTAIGFAALVLGPLGVLAGCASDGGAVSSGERSEGPALDGAGAVTHPELRAALMDLYERDQAARGAMVAMMQDAERTEGGGMRFTGEQYALVKAVNDIDAESTAFMKEAIAEHGWPGSSMVGEDGAKAAWILVQHADAEPDFQASCLPLLEAAVNAGEGEPRHLALLTDRVVLKRDGVQVYGTQFRDDAEGVLRPAPIREYATVDERRAAVGLPPLAEYAASMGESYGQAWSVEPVEVE